MDERRRTHAVRRSESIGAQRSRWAFFSNLHEKELLSQTSGLQNKALFSAPVYLWQQNKPLRRQS